MNKIHRRDFLKYTTAVSVAAAFPALSGFTIPGNDVGISVASYWLRWREGGSTANPTWHGSYEMAEHCQQIGAGGAQISVRNWDSDYAKKVRQLAETKNFWLEGQVSMPKSENDLDAFEKNIMSCNEAGIDIVRVACLSGRRYMTFKTLEEWNQFKKDSIKSIRLAEPVMRRHKVKLAIENHKDWTADEMVTILKDFDSEWLGCNLDTGNNLSFLEDPYEVVEKLAPYAFTTHFKDMGLEPYKDGFLLSEVPFGEGFLDLPRMIATIKKHNPNVKFNLEMMTRDPLEIPFLTESYWVTFGDRKASDLAKNLKLIRENYSDKKLQRTTSKSFHEQLAMEEANQVACLNFARESLGMG